MNPKNNIFCIFICLWVSVSLEAQIKGDVDGDGIVAITDALCISQKLSGISVEPYNEEIADIDCNGKVEIKDSVIIAQFYVKIIPYILCEVLPDTENPENTKKDDIFTISCSRTKGGRIFPQGDILIKKGESLDFIFYSDNNYAIYFIIVDGKVINNFEGKFKDKYIFNYVARNHTIEAVFRKAKLTWARYVIKPDIKGEQEIEAPLFFETVTFFSPFPIHTEKNLYTLWGHTPVQSKTFNRWIIESGSADIKNIYNNKTDITNIYGDTLIKPIYKNTNLIIIQ